MTRIAWTAARSVGSGGRVSMSRQWLRWMGVASGIRLARGTYKVLVTVQPPTMMRMEAALNKWLKPVQAVFTFEVK